MVSTLKTMFGFIQPLISRFLNHWLQPYLAREMTLDFKLRNLVLYAGLTDVDFAPDKLNELLSKYNLPFIINDARIDELSVEVHFEVSGYKVKIIVNGLKATVIPLQANYCPNLIDSMIDSFYEHQQSMPIEEIFSQLQMDSDRYKDSAAEETSKKLLLSLNDIVDISLVNCAIRMEHFAANSASGIALEFQVGRIRVHSDPTHGKADQDQTEETASTSSFSRLASVERVSLYTEEIMRSTEVPFNQNTSGIGESVWNESFHKQDSTPIKIASIHDEALIRISHDDKTNKSSVSLVGTVPDAVFYLTPRQIFLISELLTEISQKPPPKSDFLKSEPLTNEDYDMLERQEAVGATTADLNSVSFGSDLESHASGRLPHGSNASAWSVPKAEYPLSQPFDKDYHPRPGSSYVEEHPYNKPLYCQSVASDATSVIAPSDITFQSQRESGRPESVNRSRDEGRDPLKHVSELCVDIVLQSASFVILHEDVIAPVGAASHKELEREAEQFFAMFEGQEKRASTGDFVSLRKLLAKHCQKNHFQIHSSKVALKFVNSQRSEELQLAVLSRVHNMEFIECISDKDDENSATFVELLVFKNDGLLSGGNPCFNLSYDCKSEIRNTYKGMVDLGNSKTDISLALANCSTEVDLSLIDRAEAFFQSPSFSDEDLSTKSGNDLPSLLDRNSETTALILIHIVNFSCSCASVDVSLRFPVPDLRPMSDVLTKPVWKRDLRSDVLTLHFEDLDVLTSFTSPADHALEDVRVLSRSASLNFQESADTERYLIGEASSRSEADRVALTFRFGRGQAKKGPKYATDIAHDVKPFYEKNLVSDHKDAISEPLLYPAKEKTFATFVSENCRDADVYLDADIPCLSLFLPSKHIYEVIYNRLAYDLLLWQPHSAHPLMTKQNRPVFSEKVNLRDPGASIYHSFSCDPDDEQLMSTVTSVPALSLDTTSRSPSDPAPEKPAVEEVRMSAVTKFGLAMRVGEGSIELITPHRDAKGQLSPVARGRILLDIGQASLHVAAGFRGDLNKTYVGVFARNATLAHHPAWISELNEPKEMSLVVRRCSPEDLKNICTFSTDEQSMLSLVMNFDFDEGRNVSSMVLSGKLNHASYKYEALPAQDMWLMQLQDMFSVQDYPIQGYEIPEVVNDIHFSFMNCLVTYHPEGFDTDILLHIGSMILASSLSFNCNASIFRTIVEDSGVFIRKEFPKLQPILAQVLNLGVLQLTLRQALSKLHKVPNTELIIVGALVSLITCTDTLAELMKYVTHFCEATGVQSDELDDSDMDTTRELEPSPPTETDELELQHRRELLAEAINEVRQESDTVPSPPKKNHRGHHHRNKGKNSAAAEAKRPAFNDRCTVLERLNKVDQGMPHEIAIFNNNPWPDKKQSLPKHTSMGLPATPVVRYNIKELSFCWKLCQGRALTPEPCSPVLSATASPSSVSYSSRESRLLFNQPSPSVKRKETSAGRGNNRSLRPMVEINVKKLRYCVEFYSPESMVVCHHQIGVKDVEILDLVPASNLRKLLCRYVTEEYPIGEKSDFICIDLMVKKRPNEYQCEECDLDISMGNVRMYADQATVTFLVEFFKEMSQIRDESHAQAVRSARAKLATGSSSSAPSRQHKPASQPATTRAVHAPTKPFFKSVVFNPAVVIVIDFEGNFSDINSLNELMLALSSANKITLKLKEINFKRGLLGLDKVMEYLRKEWVDDIYANQKLGLVKMIAPVGLLIEIVGGMWQLVEAPIQQYMKDGNIFRGLMIGSQAFTCRSMAATFGLLGKMFNCMENVASYLMVIVTPTYRIEGTRAPPSDAVAGVCVATNLIRSRVARVTSNVIESTQTERRERGVAGAVSGFARHIPEMVITPPFLATQVTGCILTGLQHQWTPGNEKELQQKYK